MERLEVSKPIENFLAFMRECESQYHMAEAEEQETSGLINDILHSLELEDHSYHEFANLGKELKEARQRRRTAKDIKLTVQPVLAWTDENRNVIKGLERLLGDVRKAEKNTENRIYTPRCRSQK